MPLNSTLLVAARLLDESSERIGRAIAWLTAAMVTVTFVIVVLRYLFDKNWIALQESVTYMHALVFMLGAAYTLKHNGHVRVDIFYLKMGPRGRAWVDLLGALLLLLPMMGFLFYISWDYVFTSWSMLEGSPETGGLPGVFLLKTSMLALGLLLILQGVGQVVHNYLFLRGIEYRVAEHSPYSPAHATTFPEREV